MYILVHTGFTKELDIHARYSPFYISSVHDIFEAFARTSTAALENLIRG